jgi:hypothetical protein
MYIPEGGIPSLKGKVAGLHKNGTSGPSTTLHHNTALFGALDHRNATASASHHHHHHSHNTTANASHHHRNVTSDDSLLRHHNATSASLHHHNNVTSPAVISSKDKFKSKTTRGDESSGVVRQHARDFLRHHHGQYNAGAGSGFGVVPITIAPPPIALGAGTNVTVGGAIGNTSAGFSQVDLDAAENGTITDSEVKNGNSTTGLNIIANDVGYFATIQIGTVSIALPLIVTPCCW